MKKEDISELYLYLFELAEFALWNEPGDPVRALSGTLTEALDRLSDLYYAPTEERLLMASCALSAVHSAAFLQNIPVLVDLSPSGLLSFADKMTDLKLNTKRDDDDTDIL